MKLLTGLLLVVAFPLGASAASSAAPEGDTSAPLVSIRLDGPPAAREAIELSLTSGGADVGAEGCETVVVDGLPVLECSALEVGTYALSIGGVTDDMVVDTFCTDLVATPVDPDAIVVDPNLGEVLCDVSVASPSILLEAQYDNPFDPTLLDASGNEVPCVADDLMVQFDFPVVFQRRWCETPAGTYRVDRDSIDPVFVDSFSCNTFGPVVEPFEEIVITGDIPWIGCAQGSVGPIILHVEWTGPEDQPAAWFDDLSVALRDDGGAVTACSRIESFSQPGIRAAGIFCDVSIGSFNVVLSGLPEGAVTSDGFTASADPAEPCEVLENSVNVQGRCAISITTPDAPVPDPVELPATGWGNAQMVALGSVLLALGLGLLAGSRRRTV